VRLVPVVNVEVLESLVHLELLAELEQLVLVDAVELQVTELTSREQIIATLAILLFQQVESLSGSEAVVVKQEARLSQRNRATLCIVFVSVNCTMTVDKVSAKSSCLSSPYATVTVKSCRRARTQLATVTLPGRIDNTCDARKAYNNEVEMKIQGKSRAGYRSSVIIFLQQRAPLNTM